MDHKELVTRCLKGFADAQLKLYNEFAPAMLGICYRYTKSKADAEDVLQHGFIKVFLNLHQYKSKGELGAWIRRIIVNTTINYLKQNKRYSTELSYDEIKLHPVSDENPQVGVDAKELANLIRQLPTGCQTIFNLYAIEGCTHVEIGGILGIHEGTSRSQYARARSLLISWIEMRNGENKQKRYAGK